jgi:hypothetical protein
MEIVLFLIVVYFLCKLVEKIGEWFENEYPSYQEAQHKKIRKETFGVGQPEELLGLQPKNLETLERRAAAYALKMTIHMQDWPAATQKEYYDMHYNYYFNKYKYIYS